MQETESKVQQETMAYWQEQITKKQKPINDLLENELKTLISRLADETEKMTVIYQTICDISKLLELTNAQKTATSNIDKVNKLVSA